MSSSVTHFACVGIIYRLCLHCLLSATVLAVCIEAANDEQNLFFSYTKTTERTTWRGCTSFIQWAVINQTWPFLPFLSMTLNFTKRKVNTVLFFFLSLADLCPPVYVPIHSFIPHSHPFQEDGRVCPRWVLKSLFLPRQLGGKWIVLTNIWLHHYFCFLSLCSVLRSHF